MITRVEDIVTIKTGEVGKLIHAVEVNSVIDKREVVNLTVNTIEDTNNMKKTIYDIDDDGIVDYAKDLYLTTSDWTQFDLILLS